MSEDSIGKGTISVSTAKLTFGQVPPNRRGLRTKPNGHPLQEDLFANGRAKRTTLRAPSLPLEDNTPEAMQALLAANRHYRQIEWPAPHNRTTHRLHRGDARDLSWIPDASVHLVVTSPPYWTLKVYAAGNPDQMGHIEGYEGFLAEMDLAWKECARVLVGGGRICCVVGDVCISRKRGGRHHLVPLHADIQVRARKLGLDCLMPIRLFEDKRYKHRASNQGDFIAMHLYEDLITINRSPKLLEAVIERKDRVLNVQNKRRGVAARRGDATATRLPEARSRQWKSEWKSRYWPRP